MEGCQYRDRDGDRQRRLHLRHGRGNDPVQLAGSGDHSDVGDDEIAKHFEEKEWPTQLLSIRSQITKTTLDTKCEEYQAIRHQRKTKLRNWKIVEWFRQANTRVIKAIRDHLLPKKAEKGGPKTAQLRQLFMTAQMTAIVDGEHTEINLETAECIWTMPVVKLWADILALFEGKGRSGSSSFWSLMCNAVKSVTPRSRVTPEILQLLATTSTMPGKACAKCTRRRTTLSRPSSIGSKLSSTSK